MVPGRLVGAVLLCAALLLPAPAGATNYRGVFSFFGSFVGGFIFALALSFGRWAWDDWGSWKAWLFASFAFVFGLATAFCVLVAYADTGSFDSGMLLTAFMGAGFGFCLSVAAWGVGRWLSSARSERPTLGGASMSEGAVAPKRLARIAFYTVLACFLLFWATIFALLLRSY